MPSVRETYTNDTNDFDIENDCEEEVYNNEENSIIKCGEILLFKYNLLLSCNYCEETLYNFDIFKKHLLENHLNSDINQSSVNYNNEIDIVLEDNITEELLHTNELEQNEYFTSVEEDNTINYTKFDGCSETIKNQTIEEINYNIEESDIIKNISSEEIHSPIINNIIDEDRKDLDDLIKKDLEVQDIYLPILGNSFKQKSESYEEKFYKYCKLFQEKEVTEIRKSLNDKFNSVVERSNTKQKSNSITKSFQQVDNFTQILPNIIKLEESNDAIFDDNIIIDIIEEDPTMSFIENPTENIATSEETITFDENHTDNIIDHEIKMSLENNNNVEINLNNLEQHSQINNENFVKIEDKTPTKFDHKHKGITAISTKVNDFYHCPDCPRYYRRFDTLKIHYRLHTGEKNPYTCSICDKSFCAPCKLIQHHRVHTNERPYKCTICPQAFKAKQKLKNHLESHEKGTIKTPSRYINGVSLLERQPACLPILIDNKFITSTEAKKDDGLFHCPICERKYRRFESLKEHAETHVEAKQYECHVCNKRFTKIRSLKVHLKSHTQNKNLRWNGVPIACDYCEKTFSNKYYLNQHLSVHSGKRAYACNVCNKRFVFKSNFVLHERTHYGDKRYQCKYCDMKFVQSSTKVRHERVVHLKLAPFTCRFCQKGFYTSSIYKKHINDHKNEGSNSKDIYDEKENYINNENENKTIIANDNIEQTIIVDNNEENIIVVENDDFNVHEFICSNCGAYFLDCGEFIEHCKAHDNNLNEQNIVHYMQNDIVESEEIIV